MQNKANLLNAKNERNYCLHKDYENERLRTPAKNKANQTQSRKVIRG
jgi:hypothetical protein